MRRVLLVLLAIAPACTTHYRATVPPTAGGAAIDHCLQSFGLTHRSIKPAHAASLAADSELVAVWDALQARTSQRLRATVFVRKQPEQWQISFVPESGSYYAATYAHGFARCMTVHDPAVEVDVISLRGPGRVSPSSR